MTDIFLSYAREDLERARTMARALEDEGWSVFWDRRIPPGRRFEDYIEERIKQARVVVVLWSPDSVVSDWVRLEAAHARDRKPSGLIPAVIAPLTPPAEIPFAFRHIQAADLSGWQAGARGIEFEEMLASIESLAPRPRMPTRPVESASTSESVSSRESSLPTEPASARQAPRVADTPPVAPRSEPVDRVGDGPIESIEKDEHDRLRLPLGREGAALNAPSRSEWHEQEKRFALINGELNAMWEQVTGTGQVTWNVNPEGFQGQRRVERFFSEATIAGKMAMRVPSLPLKFNIRPTDPVDHWLNVVAGLVHPASSLDATGHDDRSGESTVGGEIRQLVEASKLACARLAGEFS